MKRILLAGLLAGLALFVWEFIAHEFLPLGEAGFKAIPNEAAAVAAMKDTIKEAGLFYFPAPELTPGMTNTQKQEAMQQAAEKSATSPTGLMVFHPNGVPFSFPKSLAIQFAGDVVVMWIAGWLLAQVSVFAGFAMRVTMAGTMGLIPSLRTDIPYWNWYNFPGVYTASQLTIHIVGFLLGGLILAKMIRAAAK